MDGTVTSSTITQNQRYWTCSFCHIDNFGNHELHCIYHPANLEAGFVGRNDTKPYQQELMGWICPRCGKVWAWFIESCNCHMWHYTCFSSGATGFVTSSSE